jgi:serine/threonine protein kinase
LLTTANVLCACSGLAPRLLGHRSFGEYYFELDLEYLPPYTIKPTNRSEMQTFARGLLQVIPTSVVRSMWYQLTVVFVAFVRHTKITNRQALARIHELGLIHLDIKAGRASSQIMAAALYPHLTRFSKTT